MVCTSVSISWISKIIFSSVLYIATLSDTHKFTQCVLTIHDKNIYIYISIDIYIYICFCACLDRRDSSVESLESENLSSPKQTFE